MKKAATILVALLIGLTAQASAQDIRLKPQETRLTEQPELHIEGSSEWQAVPFAPAVSKEQILENLSPEERQRLHPYFQAVLAERRLGTERPLDPVTARTWPGVSIGEDGRTRYSATIYTTDPTSLERAGIHVNSSYPGFVTARLTTEQAERLAVRDDVTSIEPAELTYPANDMSITATGANLLHEGYVRNTPYQGEGTIVCVFDTGIDFRHGDFIDEDGESRILSIWDQTLEDRRSGEERPQGFDYGVEYRREHINNELGDFPAGFVRQRDESGHGTHVAGTAAGNGLSYHGVYRGMAPETELVIVKGGDDSFPTTNMIDALTYCGNVADDEGKPVVVNFSLGGQFGAHDGSRDHEQAIDHFSTNPGRVVVASAGNDGDRPIHISRTVSPGRTITVEFDVPSYDPEPGSDNDFFRFDAWFDEERDVTVRVTSPSVNGHRVTDAFAVGEAGTLEDDSAGTIFVSHTLSEAAGGPTLRTNLQVYDGDASRPPTSGRWRLVFRNNDSSPTTFHGWMYQVGGGLSDTELVGGDRLYTITSPGNSRRAITVGSYNTRIFWPSRDGRTYSFQPAQDRHELSSFSSIGPTRDGRIKPDLVAPGRTIVSSRSRSGSFQGATITPSDRHRATQGTSMSAPHVSGAAAILLSQFPSSSADEIKDLLTASAQQDSFTSTSMTGIPDARYAWGAGKLNAFRALVYAFGGALAANDRYENATQPGFVIRLEQRRLAVRFTPLDDGVLSGFEVHMANLNEDAGFDVVKGEGMFHYALYNDNGGLPGQPLTEVLSRPIEQITPTSIPHFSLLAAERSAITVEAGRDYHVVFFQEDTSDTFEIFSDDGSSGTGRSSVYESGAGWRSTGEYFSEPVEFLVTAIVTRTDDAAEIPVVVDLFDTEVLNGEARLTWRTAREWNTDTIEVQHKPPRGTFQTIGTVSGGGTTNEPRDYSFTISDFRGVGEHHFRFRYVSDGGAWSFSEEFTFLQEVDGRYELSHPYPNPFTNQTNILLSVAEEQEVQVYVFDLLGRHLATLWDGPIPANFEEVITYRDPALSSGVYLIRVVGEHFAATRKATMVR